MIPHPGHQPLSFSRSSVMHRRELHFHDYRHGTCKKKIQKLAICAYLFLLLVLLCLLRRSIAPPLRCSSAYLSSTCMHETRCIRVILGGRRSWKVRSHDAQFNSAARKLWDARMGVSGPPAFWQSPDDALAPTKAYEMSSSTPALHCYPGTGPFIPGPPPVPPLPHGMQTTLHRIIPLRGSLLAPI